MRRVSIAHIFMLFITISVTWTLGFISISIDGAMGAMFKKSASNFYSYLIYARILVHPPTRFEVHDCEMKFDWPGQHNI